MGDVEVHQAGSHGLCRALEANRALFGISNWLGGSPRLALRALAAPGPLEPAVRRIEKEQEVKFLMESSARLDAALDPKPPATPQWPSCWPICLQAICQAAGLPALRPLAVSFLECGIARL